MGISHFESGHILPPHDRVADPFAGRAPITAIAWKVWRLARPSKSAGARAWTSLPAINPRST
jgi:hypothetical protein